MLYRGDLIQTDKGLFYVVSVNPTMIQSMTGGPRIELKSKYTKLANSIIEDYIEEELPIPTKIRNFIKECLSL